jgi:hypothetical protein
MSFSARLAPLTVSGRTGPSQAVSRRFTALQNSSGIPKLLLYVRDPLYGQCEPSLKVRKASSSPTLKLLPGGAREPLGPPGCNRAAQYHPS